MLGKYLITINLLFDVFSFGSRAGGFMAIFRASIIYIIFFYEYFIKKMRFNFFPSIIIFSLYSLTQLVFSQDFLYSLRVTLQIITSLLSFYLGYNIIKNENDLKDYFSQYFFVYIIIIINTIISNYFKLGIDGYTKDQDYVVGGLYDQWSTFSYSILFFPILLQITYTKKKKLLLIIFVSIVFILLLLSIKRSAIITVFIGLIIFGRYLSTKKQLVLTIVTVLTILFITSPFYLDLFKYRFEQRNKEKKINDIYYLQEEGRYLEFIYLYEKYIFDKPFLEVLFGKKAFDSRGALQGELGIDRQLHVDYTLIFYTIGLIGLFLYFNIYRKLLLIIKKLRNFSYSRMNNNFTKILWATSIVLVYCSLYTSLGGQMYNLTFRMMIFMSLGVILKYLTKIKKNESINRL